MMTDKQAIPGSPSIERAARLLQERNQLLFITGAGISADAGLPTYRGIGGLYNSGTTEEGLRIEEALSGEMLTARPEVTWRHLLQIEQACRDAAFSRGHAIIAEMERHFERVWVLTQNIDGFHLSAGSKNVIDIHGDIHRLRCTRCRHQETVADYSGFRQVPPPCPECGAVLRPEVVFFGERLPADKLAQLQTELKRGFDAVFTIGTTSVFPYIAGPVLAARRAGVPTVEINPGESEVSHLVNIKIAAGAAATLEAIWERYKVLERSDSEV